MNSTTGENSGSKSQSLQDLPYEVISDKALAQQDYLYKLIIIGDTGKNSQ